jgi:hypothetical protein
MIGLAMVLSGSGFGQDAVVIIELSRNHPEQSRAKIRQRDGSEIIVPVGSGKNGIRPEGSRFASGWSLLGVFRVNAILSTNQFEMEPRLIQESGRSGAELRAELFAGMSRIDFNGDGHAGEYGEGFIGLAPEAPGDQPFGFGEYGGVFRWYSYAIHGTEDETRVGKRSTGGCINLKKEDLRQLLAVVELGDRVEIREIP